MRKLDFCIAKTKAPISRAVTAQLIGAFVFATRIVKFSSFYSQNFKLLAFFCDYTGWFMSDLVGNPEDRFSRLAAQMEIKQIIET